MKKHDVCAHLVWMLYAFVFSISASLCFGDNHSQDISHRQFNFNDPNQRQTFIKQLREKHRPGIERAAEYLRKTGKPKRWQNGQSICELMSIEEDGQFVVYTTLNANSAISITADIVRDDPYYGLNGNNITVGVWDAGIARPTHQELVGKITWKDTAAPVDNYHSTAVAGTIAATGIDPAAKGMAPLTQIWSYEWTDDTTEMTAIAMSSPSQTDKIQISNHSYGPACGWYKYSNSPEKWYWYGNSAYDECYLFGAYLSSTSDVDQICYDAPYYLPIQAVGNDRNQDSTYRPAEGAIYYINGTIEATFYADSGPYADNYDNGGFDTLLPNACAKNILAVGGVNDAVTDGIRDLSKALSTYLSAWGPTDDGRIKPDVVTNCYQIYSSDCDSDTDYRSLTGTSMAAPAAAGVAAQLIELYGRLFPSQYMRSSTIKALLIHTADDLGNPGPDYKFGWGLINAESAADKIRLHKRNPTAMNFKEDSISRNQTDTYTFQWDGVSPIKATLCWTDPAGAASSALDSTSLKLQNDLDLTITAPDGAIYYPFVLNPSSPNTPAITGTNNRDNVEQVLVSSPTQQGTYSVKVKSIDFSWLTTQNYSLILSGQRQPAAWDIDGDYVIGLGDLAAISNSWLAPASDSDIYPAIGDGIVDLHDFTLINQMWTEP